MRITRTGIRAAIAVMLSFSVASPQRNETLLEKRKLEPGIYVWDGLAGDSAGDHLGKSLEMLDRIGFHAVRLLLSPASQRAYSLPPLRCEDGRRSLSCLFLSSDFQEALSVKTIDTVMFTTYDFASFFRQRYLDPEFLKTERQRVFDEYRDLAETIMRKYSGTGKVFVISHWEGDNQVYCGSSYEFQTIDDKRYACMYQNPAARLVGITEWLKIRQEAIAEGRQRAIAAGASHVEVYHAVEFNSLFATRKVSGASIRSKEYKGILDTVIPAVRPDLCSYSAWESTNRNRLTKDLQDIARACAPARVIVGEIGIKNDEDRRYGKLVSALEPLKESVPAVFFWQAFESSTSKDPGFALFDRDGKERHARALQAIHQMQ